MNNSIVYSGRRGSSSKGGGVVVVFILLLPQLSPAIAQTIGLVSSGETRLQLLDALARDIEHSLPKYFEILQRRAGGCPALRGYGM